MKKQEFLTEYRFFLDKVYKKVCEKNADYSGAAGDDNPLHNIRMVETLHIADTETGILTRLSDKFARIATFVKKGVLQVKDESVEDTIMDFVGYLVILAIQIKDRRKDKEPEAGLNWIGARAKTEEAICAARHWSRDYDEETEADPPQRADPCPVPECSKWLGYNPVCAAHWNSLPPDIKRKYRELGTQSDLGSPSPADADMLRGYKQAIIDILADRLNRVPSTSPVTWQPHSGFQPDET